MQIDLLPFRYRNLLLHQVKTLQPSTEAKIGEREEEKDQNPSPHPPQKKKRETFLEGNSFTLEARTEFFVMGISLFGDFYWSRRREMETEKQKRRIQKRRIFFTEKQPCFGSKNRFFSPFFETSVCEDFCCSRRGENGEIEEKNKEKSKKKKKTEKF